MGQAVFGPTYSALLPALVGREDLAGAISLNSAQMNGSRVIGPIIGAVHLRRGRRVVGVRGQRAVLPAGDLVAAERAAARRRCPTPAGREGMRRLLSGFQIARDDPIVGRCLIIIFTFSLLSLPFIGQMPTLADRNLGIAAKSTQYGVLYACFGVGALLGALSIGTVLAGRRLERVVRVGPAWCSPAFLAVFSLLRAPGARVPRASCSSASPTSR